MNRPVKWSSARRVAYLEAGDVVELPGAVLAQWHRLVLPGSVVGQDPAAAVQEWIRRVGEEWGPVGQVMRQGETLLGLAAYAPPSWLPGAVSRPSGPVSPDAVLLAGVYVVDGQRRRGLGRHLVQAVAKDLVQRPGPPAAVEAFAGEDPALLPVGFCAKVGFEVRRDHPTVPRMRMDLRRTVRHRAESALTQLAGAIRPRPAVAPRPLGREPRTLRAGRTAP